MRKQRGEVLRIVIETLGDKSTFVQDLTHSTCFEILKEMPGTGNKFDPDKIPPVRSFFDNVIKAARSHCDGVIITGEAFLLHTDIREENYLVRLISILEEAIYLHPIQLSITRDFEHFCPTLWNESASTDTFSDKRLMDGFGWILDAFFGAYEFLITQPVSAMLERAYMFHGAVEAGGNVVEFTTNGRRKS